MFGLSRWLYLPWTGILVIALAILGGTSQVDALWSFPPWISALWTGTGQSGVGAPPASPTVSGSVSAHPLYNDSSCMQVFTTLAKFPLSASDLVEPQRLCRALLAAQRTALTGPVDGAAIAQLSHEMRTGFQRVEGHLTVHQKLLPEMLNLLQDQEKQIFEMRRDFNATTEELRMVKSKSTASLLDFGIASCFLWTVVLGFIVSMIHRNMLRVTPERTFVLFIVWSMAAFVELIAFQVVCLGLESLFGVFSLWALVEPFVAHGLWICAPLFLDLVLVSGAVGLGVVARLGLWAGSPSEAVSMFADPSSIDRPQTANLHKNKAIPAPFAHPVAATVYTQFPGALAGTPAPGGSILHDEEEDDAQPEPSNEGVTGSTPIYSVPNRNVADLKRRLRSGEL